MVESLRIPKGKKREEVMEKRAPRKIVEGTNSSDITKMRVGFQRIFPPDDKGPFVHGISCPGFGMGRRRSGS